MSSKKQNQKVERTAPSLASILGIEPAPRFELLGSIFEAKPMTLTEQMQFAKLMDITTDKDALPAQAELLTDFLRSRLVEGSELTVDEVAEAVDVPTGTRLFQLLQGVRKARHTDDKGEGAEGK